MFKTDEYMHLLAAERAMVDTLALKEGVKPSEKAQCARALVDVIQMKRFMRGAPNPKPVEMLPKGRKRKAENTIEPFAFEAPPQAQTGTDPR